MNWALAGVAGLCVWVLLGVDYARRLHRVLDARRARLLRELDHFVQRARDWESAVAEGSHREWRDSAAALERVLQRLGGETSLDAKVDAARSLAVLLSRQEEVLAGHLDSFPASAPTRAAQLRAASGRVQKSYGEYAAAEADAVFICSRFPLSGMAAIARLREPNR